MTRSMGTVDRCVQAFVVAQVAIIGGTIIGASTLGGIVVAGITLRRTRHGGSLGRWPPPLQIEGRRGGSEATASGAAAPPPTRIQRKEVPR